MDCKDAFESGRTSSGIYLVNPDNQTPFKVSGMQMLHNNIHLDRLKLMTQLATVNKSDNFRFLLIIQYAGLL